MKFLVVDGCPAPRRTAPYIYLVVRGAGMTAESIYRGEDAKALLHRHGKRTQAEIHIALPDISNPEGQSQHDLHSDGVGNAGPVGRQLEEWEVGVDSGANDPASKARVEAAAQRLGWRVRHPYSRGVEGHHWCFAERPKPKGVKQRAQIVGLRITLLFADRPALALNSKGRRAQTLKRRLAKLGYLKKYRRGPIKADAVKALKAFQADHHLTVDGIAGPATQLAIKKAIDRQPKKPSKPTPPKPAIRKKVKCESIDISEHNGSVDMHKLHAADIPYIQVRVCDGDYHDKLYGKPRVTAIRNAKLTFSPYFYSRVASPGNKERDGAAECRMQLGFARDGGWDPKRDGRGILDAEEANKQSAEKAARHFPQWVRQYVRETGDHPVIYTGYYFWQSLVPHLSRADRRLLRKCPVWIAAYGSTPRVPAPWKKLVAHQDTDKWPLPGDTSRRVDHSHVLDLRRMRGR